MGYQFGDAAADEPWTSETLALIPRSMRRFPEDFQPDESSIDPVTGQATRWTRRLNARELIMWIEGTT